MLDERRIDILFANQAEIEALAGVPHLETAVAAVKDKVDTLVVTRSEDGALATRGGERTDVPAEPIAKLVDTTGAGDLFAAGFLLGEARGARPREVAAARRDLRRRGDPALRRAPRGGPQGAGRRVARLVARSCGGTGAPGIGAMPIEPGASAASSGTSVMPRPTWLWR